MKKKIHFSFFFFIKLIILIGIVYTAINRNLPETIFSSTILLITFFPMILLGKKNVKIPKILENSFLIGILILIILRIVVSQYINFFWFNPMVFILSGIVLSILSFLNAYIAFKDKATSNPFFISLFTFSFPLAIALITELIEYIFAIKNSIIHELYLQETMIQLSMIVIGATIVSVYVYLYLAYGSKNFISVLAAKFKKENPVFLESKVKRASELILKGESDNLEFKSTLRYNLFTKKSDNKMEHSVLKTISAFLNSSGGDLFIGVSDDGTILGIKEDNFPSNDKFHLHFINLINKSFTTAIKNLINSDFIEIENKFVFWVKCKSSKKPIFLISGNQDKFYTRVGPSTIELTGSKLLSNIKDTF